VSQARQYVFRFRAKPHLTLALKLSQQSATAKALPLIQQLIFLAGCHRLDGRKSCASSGYAALKAASPTPTGAVPLKIAAVPGCAA
jgi:hypothetical protein